LSHVGELGLASSKFIRILDPPAATTKLPNLTKKLSMLTTTRRWSSRSPNFICSSRSSRRRWSSWGIRAPEARRRRISQSADPPVANSPFDDDLPLRLILPLRSFSLSIKISPC